MASRAIYGVFLERRVYSKILLAAKSGANKSRSLSVLVPLQPSARGSASLCQGILGLSSFNLNKEHPTIIVTRNKSSFPRPSDRERGSAPSATPRSRSPGSPCLPPRRDAAAVAAVSAVAPSRSDGQAEHQSPSPPARPPGTSGPAFSPAAFPPESALHGELGAAIASAVPDGGKAVAARPASSPSAVPDFEDTAASFGAYSTWDLIRGFVVLQACSIRALVERSEALLRFGYATAGETVTDGVLGRTFFAHFCAGETAQEVGRRAGALRALGVGSILDYAAEEDVQPSTREAAARSTPPQAPEGKRLLHEVRVRPDDETGAKA